MKKVTKTAQMPIDLVDQINKQAKEEDRTFSAMLVRIVKEWAEKQKEAA